MAHSAASGIWPYPRCALPQTRARVLRLSHAKTIFRTWLEKVYKVIGVFNPLFAAEVVDCVAEDRAPTIQELFSVAERIGRDAGMRPIFAWDGPCTSSQEERFLLRAAHAALCGATGSR